MIMATVLRRLFGCCQGRPEKTGKLWSEATRLAGADRRANRTLADGASPGQQPAAAWARGSAAAPGQPNKASRHQRSGQETVSELEELERELEEELSIGKRRSYHQGRRHLPWTKPWPALATAIQLPCCRWLRREASRGLPSEPASLKRKCHCAMALIGGVSSRRGWLAEGAP